MIRTHILQYGPYAFVLLLLVFVLVKFWLIRKRKMDTPTWELFFNTIVPMSKQSIKNTFQEKLKKYYKQSNKVNSIFYILFAVTGLIYFLMKAIV